MSVKLCLPVGNGREPVISISQLFVCLRLIQTGCAVAKTKGPDVDNTLSVLSEFDICVHFTRIDADFASK